MGSLFSKTDERKPSKSEQLSASVAMYELDRFFDKFSDVFAQQQEDAKSGAQIGQFRRRSNADLAQTYGQPTYLATQDLTRPADMAATGTTLLGETTATAKDFQNKLGLQNLEAGRGLASQAQKGMAIASNLSTSDVLEKARNREALRGAKVQAIADVGAAYGKKNPDSLVGKLYKQYENISDFA